MKYHLLLFLVFLGSLQIACTQVPAERPAVLNPEFDKKISQLISFSVPVIGPKQLKSMDQVWILDAREKEEYQVSHIENARFIGYNRFDPSSVADIPKDQKIVLYCSIGYRSEKIGEKLQKMGYSNVYNLYGSIFEWVNQGNPVVDSKGQKTSKVHSYNKAWGRWLEEGKAEKVW